MTLRSIAQWKAALGLPSCFSTQRGFRQAALAAAGAAMVLASPSSAETETSTLLLAVAAPASGPRAALGRDVIGAVRIAVDDVNARGGIAGRRLRIEVFDDGCSTPGGAKAAAAVVASGAVAIVGHPCANAASAALPVYAKSNVLAIVAGATHPRLTAPRGSPLAFRIPAAESPVGAFVAQALAQAPEGARIALLRDRTAIARGQMQDVLAGLQKRGRTPVLIDTFAGGDKDFRLLAGRLKAAAITHVALAAFPNEGALLVRDIHALIADAVVVGTDLLADADFGRVAGPGADGTRVAVPNGFRGPAGVEALALRLAGSGLAASRPALAAFASIEAWAQAAAGAGPDAAGVARSLSAGTRETILGSLAFDERGDARLQHWEFLVWNRGRLSPSR